MDKYKELYDFAREAVAQSEARFDAVDAKASNYLSVFTVLLGAAGFFVKWVADSLIPPGDLLESILGILAVMTAGLVAATWVQLLRVLKVHRIQVIPLNDETIKFFRHNRVVDVYFGLSRTLTDVWGVNQSVNEAKLRALTRAYRLMMVTLVLVVAFAFLYVFRVWSVGGTAT